MASMRGRNIGFVFNDAALQNLKYMKMFSVIAKNSDRSRIRTKHTQTTTDRHKSTQIDISNQSVFICVHLRFELPFSKYRER
jgi:hypothetical protein